MNTLWVGTDKGARYWVGGKWVGEIVRVFGVEHYVCTVAKPGTLHQCRANSYEAAQRWVEQRVADLGWTVQS